MLITPKGQNHVYRKLNFQSPVLLRSEQIAANDVKGGVTNYMRDYLAYDTSVTVSNVNEFVELLTLCMTFQHLHIVTIYRHPSLSSTRFMEVLNIT